MNCVRVTLPCLVFLYGRPRRLFATARLRSWSWVVLFARCLGMAKVSVAIMALVALQFVLLEKPLLDQMRSGSRGGSL